MRDVNADSWQPARILVLGEGEKIITTTKSCAPTRHIIVPRRNRVPIWYTRDDLLSTEVGTLVGSQKWNGFIVVITTRYCTIIVIIITFTVSFHRQV